MTLPNLFQQQIEQRKLPRKLPDFTGNPPILIDLEVLQNYEYFKEKNFQHNRPIRLAFDEAKKLRVKRWYRECTIIQTNDLDFAILANEINDKLLNFFDELNGKFRVQRRLGRRRDSLQFTLEHSRDRFTIDIFFLYVNGTSHYISSQGADLERYRFDYPSKLFEEICTANLHGHLFHVPCRSQEVIEQTEKVQNDLKWKNVLNVH
ncbi:unnamed protein product, partial [Mesorhabditis belari]|uniref:Uncharacterized protein n=1 Tax=Mesorhabditis belari TaxID=2138241 RepID=A0AAF3J4X7_9BILA